MKPQSLTFGALELVPSANPAVLDTATWAPSRAWQTLQGLRYDWLAARAALACNAEPPPPPGCTLYRGSAVLQGRSAFLLAGLPDAQRLLLEIGSDTAPSLLGTPLGQVALAPGLRLSAYPADASVVDRFCRDLQPENRPRALGPTPRLGLGTRMSAAVWPGLFRGMNRGHFAANAIQNSVRELNLLSELQAGVPPERNYYCGFGTIESGHTGGTFEGLWLAGVLAALEHPRPLCYGADADHLQLKRGPGGLARARRYLEAARYYTFYTLDVADVLDYSAQHETGLGAAEAYLARKIPDPPLAGAVLDYHSQPLRCGGRLLTLDRAMVGRCVGKYWDALEQLAGLVDDLGRLKAGVPFDLELSIDEHPPEVNAFDCLTTDEELLFLLRELQRRGLRVTHLAPNFGVEKGLDYRGPDGLAGFEARVRAQAQLARDFGVMLDVHSGDDLTSGPRRALQRATRGWLHFKISPSLQVLFAETLQVFAPGLFERWWHDAWDYAAREAQQGSPFAAQCLARYQEHPHPSPRQDLFYHYCFAFPGRRDERGQFLHRHELYTLPPAFYAAYAERVAAHVCRLAADLFSP